jgi:hypothetical protein
MNPLASDPASDDDRAPDSPAPAAEERSPKLWKADGWTARIIKNEDDDGWAVEMTRDGESEPALVGPWTMGRDKKNPKPIDPNGYAVLVKTANEVRARHAQQLHAQLHRSTNVVSADGTRLRVDCDVVPDDDDPHAIVTVHDRDGAIVSSARVAASFKLTSDSARKWVDGDRDG